MTYGLKKPETSLYHMVQKSFG